MTYFCVFLFYLKVTKVIYLNRTVPNKNCPLCIAMKECIIIEYIIKKIFN
jgi:hypothetical protein